MYFFLIIVGIILIIFNVRFIKDDNKVVNKIVKKDKNSFTRILEDEELNLSAVDIIVGELRMEFSETILELQKEIVELNNKIDGLVETGFEKSEVFELPREEKEVILENYNVDKGANNRTLEIGDLLNKGFSVEEISEKFQMGRGEILLIKKLYQK